MRPSFKTILELVSDQRIAEGMSMKLVLDDSGIYHASSSCAQVEPRSLARTLLLGPLAPRSVRFEEIYHPVCFCVGRWSFQATLSELVNRVLDNSEMIEAAIIFKDGVDLKRSWDESYIESLVSTLTALGNFRLKFKKFPEVSEGFFSTADTAIAKIHEAVKAGHYDTFLTGSVQASALHLSVVSDDDQGISAYRRRLYRVRYGTSRARLYLAPQEVTRKIFQPQYMHGRPLTDGGMVSDHVLAPTDPAELETMIRLWNPDPDVPYGSLKTLREAAALL